MARYIDADSLLEQISKKKCEVGKIRYLDGFNDGLMRVRSIISAAPTADVVPKSEVVLASSDAVKMLIECHGYALTHDADIKKEVARETFAEIESKKMFLKDCVGNMGVVVLFKDISELKKKYTEEKK